MLDHVGSGSIDHAGSRSTDFLSSSHVLISHLKTEKNRTEYSRNEIKTPANKDNTVQTKKMKTNFLAFLTNKYIFFCQVDLLIVCKHK